MLYNETEGKNKMQYMSVYYCNVLIVTLHDLCQFSLKCISAATNIQAMAFCN